MVVKIRDKEVYESYKNANSSRSTTMRILWDFLDRITDLADLEVLDDNEEVEKIVNAIVAEESVEFDDPTYKVPLPLAYDPNNGQQYLVQDVLRDKFYISSLPTQMKAEFKLDEIPNEYKRFAVEVNE